MLVRTTPIRTMIYIILKNHNVHGDMTPGGQRRNTQSNGHEWPTSLINHNLAGEGCLSLGTLKDEENNFGLSKAGIDTTDFLFECAR